MNPDLVLFEATAADIGWDHRRLAELLPQGIGWDAQCYGGILQRIHRPPAATADYYAAALRPYVWDLVAQVYQAVAADCRARGVPCIWALIPRVGRPVDPADQRRLIETARAAGFTAVIDISDAFDSFDPADLAIDPSDFHPNAQGHAIIAKRLEQALWTQPAIAALRSRSSRLLAN
jgi:lysophospholipase L1-like esterase